MKRILFATDFSEACDHAYSYLQKLIHSTSIIVDFVHVYDIPIAVSASIPSQAIKGMLAAKEEAAVRRLQFIRYKLHPSQQGKLSPLQGEYPSAEIPALAKHLGDDLIVMGMKKKYSFVDRMIGSVTLHTIDKSPMPVLAIPYEAEFQPIKTVLFPTAINQVSDLSENEIRALEWLHDFMEVGEAPTIHMIHITQNAKLVDITLKNFPVNEMNFTVSQAESVEEGIFKFLTKEQINILAFYKPHRKFWSRLYHSSITRKLLYQSRLPLLVFS